MEDKELIESLLEENKRLKEILDNNHISYLNKTDIPTSIFTKEEKLDLFLSYFCGRNDIFAYQYINKEGQKRCYPFCAHKDKVNSFCKINKTCKGCEQRKYRGITKEDIIRHLKGEEVLGIYPLLDDNSTNFICVDFDDKDYQKSSLAFYKTCIKNAIDPIIEISQSGVGAHVWIFFSSPVSAYKARLACKLLLYQTTMESSTVKFESFDRMIPAQDYLDKDKGYGNLIILPLNGKKATEEKTIFVDSNYKPYPLNEQFAHLAKIRKTPIHIIDVIINENKKNENEYFSFSISSINKYHLTRLDFPNQLLIVQQNGLIIGKGGLSSLALKFIRYIASLPNPQYYEAMRRRQPIYNYQKITFPMILQLYEEDESYIKIPRGCINNIIKLLNYLNVKYEIENKECSGKKIDIGFNGELRFEQQIALKEALANKNGLIVAPPAFGKTVIALALINEIKRNALIVVPKNTLIKQWQERIKQFLIINYKTDKKNVIGTYNGQKKKLTGKIDVASLDSLTTIEGKKILDKYGIIIIDEAHHLAAPTYLDCLRSCNSKYLYGFTATPYRSDNLHKVIFKSLGNIISNNETSQSLCIKKSLYPRFTKTYYNNTTKTMSYSEQLTLLVKDNERNSQIVKDLINQYRAGRKILLLTDRIEHLSILKNLLLDIKNLFVINGETNRKELKQFYNQILELKEPFIILSIGKFIGEGFDESKLDTLSIASPFKFRGTLEQYLGRLNRINSDKKELRVFDYIDFHIPMFMNMYQERLRGYKKLDYFIQEDQSLFTKNLYTSLEYYQKILVDLKNAKENVKFFINKCDYLFVNSMMLYTDEKVNLEVYASFDFTVQYERCKVKVSNDVSFNCIVIDNSLMWFGSNNMFYGNSKVDSLMRIYNKKIVEDLLHQFSKSDN